VADIALKISGVSRSFAHLLAVDDVSLEVSAGERLAIIGPNGAGKSTLLSIVGGQVACDRGHIEFFGHDITHLPDYVRSRLGVARSFQVPNAFPEVTVEGNLAIAAAGGAEARWVGLASFPGTTQLRATLEAWGLWEGRAKLPPELSHGDRRRLELALAFASHPRVALLDEPTAGLTLRESPKLIQEIADLGRDVTVVLVDHDMSAVFAIAERIIVMHRGRVFADGTPSEVQASPAVSEIYGSLRALA
jgi:branched-chain amino acid transport system ATP-binding protein